MSSTNDQTAPEDQAELNDLGRVALWFLKLGQNASNNMAEVFDTMTARDWIRLVIIVGAYMLLRPYAEKWLGKKQVEQMEKDDKKAAALSPNDLRDGKLPGDEMDDEDEEDEAAASGASWGGKARTRQRMMLKHLLEAEERRKQEEDDDQDIADLLED